MRFEVLESYIKMCKEYGLQPDLKDLSKWNEIYQNLK